MEQDTTFDGMMSEIMTLRLKLIKTNSALAAQLQLSGMDYLSSIYEEEARKVSREMIKDRRVKLIWSCPEHPDIWLEDFDFERWTGKCCRCGRYNMKTGKEYEKDAD